MSQDTSERAPSLLDIVERGYSSQLSASPPPSGSVELLIWQAANRGLRLEEALEELQQAPLDSMNTEWFERFRGQLEREILAAWDAHFAAMARVAAKLKRSGNQAALSKALSAIESHRNARDVYRAYLRSARFQIECETIWTEMWPGLALVWEKFETPLPGKGPWFGAVQPFGLRFCQNDPDGLEDGFELFVLQEADPKCDLIDDSAFVPFRKAWEGGFKTAKQAKGFLKRMNKNSTQIRTRHPRTNRLEVHSGDWLRCQAKESLDSFEALGSKNLKIADTVLDGISERYGTLHEKKKKEASKQKRG